MKPVFTTLEKKRKRVPKRLLRGLRESLDERGLSHMDLALLHLRTDVSSLTKEAQRGSRSGVDVFVKSIIKEANKVAGYMRSGDGARIPASQRIESTMNLQQARRIIEGVGARDSNYERAKKAAADAEKDPRTAAARKKVAAHIKSGKVKTAGPKPKKVGRK